MSQTAALLRATARSLRDHAAELDFEARRLEGSPEPPPPPPPPPPTDIPPELIDAVQRGVDFWGIRMWILKRDLTPAELAYCVAHKVPGAIPPATGNGNPGAEATLTGFLLERKGHPYVNYLDANSLYVFGLDTAYGERVELKHHEIAGTHDALQVRSRVTDQHGAVLSLEKTSGNRGSHLLEASPGGRLILEITPSMSGWLGVVRY